jgi:hypothetical protein
VIALASGSGCATTTSNAPPGTSEAEDAAALEQGSSSPAARFSAAECRASDRPGVIALGNGNGIIEPGEMIEVACLITNQSRLPVPSATLEAVTSDRHVLLGRARQTVGAWAASSQKAHVFALSVSKSYAGGNELPIWVRVTAEGAVEEVPLQLHLGREPLR